MHTLYISHNTLGLSGAVALGEALARCPLTTLDLSGDFQKPEQVAALCAGLAQCTQLTWLDGSSACAVRTLGIVHAVPDTARCVWRRR